MGALKTLALLPMAGLLMVACGHPTGTSSTAMNSQLKSDLDRAASPTSDLAVSRYRPTQVMSNVEMGLGNGNQGMEAPRKTHVPRARPSLKPTVEAVSAITPRPAPQPTVIAESPEPGPTTGPRPMPNPVGSIFRGGVIADDDHCQIHPHIPAMVGRVAPERPMYGPPGMRPRGSW
jgi:hypothetical protein